VFEWHKRFSESRDSLKDDDYDDDDDDDDD
jgi:hypothetical protein